MNVSSQARSVIHLLVASAEQLERDGLLLLLHPEDGRGDRSDDVIIEVGVLGHPEDLLLVLLCDDDLIVFVLLELHRDDVQICLEDRGLVPLVLLYRAEHSVQCDAVTGRHDSGYIVFDVAHQPLGLGSSPESLGPLLNLDLLSVDVCGCLQILDETCGLLVAASVGIVAHQGLLHDHSGLRHPYLGTASGTPEQCVCHTRLYGGDLPDQSLHRDQPSEVVGPEIPDVNFSVSREIDDPDVDGVSRTVYVGDQLHDCLPCDLKTSVRLLEEIGGEFDILHGDVLEIDLDALLLRIIVCNVRYHHAVLVSAEQRGPQLLDLVILVRHCSPLSERQSSSTHQTHPPASMEISPLTVPSLRYLDRVLARSSGQR